MKLNVLSFESITSTNSYLKENYKKLDNNTVCITQTQTNGRGRLGRCWQDNPGSALFSILIKKEIKNVSFIPLISAYAILNVLKEYANNLKVKWPNDILLNSKKLVGVLVEGVSTDKIEAIIIGIGINVNNKYLSPEISDIATSLYLESNKEYDINRIILKISNLIIELLENATSDEIIDYLNEHSFLNGKEVSFNYHGRSFQGIAKDINKDGTFRIVVNNQTYDVNSGEVTLTNSYKN